MVLRRGAVARTYPPVTYAVGREAVREYALVVGERDPLHLDVGAARAAGYADVVAPPMFAVVYAEPAVRRALFDSEVGIDVVRTAHAGQEFAWGPLVVAGDEVSTGVTVERIEEPGGGGRVVFASVSTNQHGETVSVGTWTYVVRAG